MNAQAIEGGAPTISSGCPPRAFIKAAGRTVVRPATVDIAFQGVTGENAAVRDAASLSRQQRKDRSRR